MEALNEDTIHWLRTNDQPWVRYRTLLDLLERPADDTEVIAARQAMLDHPQVKELIQQAGDWPGYALKRHNDARLSLHKLAVLADFGLRHDDPGMPEVVKKIMAHQSTEGLFETLVIIPKVFGGNDEATWSWMLCDAPILLYALVGYGLGDHPVVQQAEQFLLSLVTEQGWPCASGSKLGTIQGPGRKDDPCPYANLIALRMLSLLPTRYDDPAVHYGTEMLLQHWENQKKPKLRMFGIGTDFRKLKYPFIWYDILHVVDTLSYFPFVRQDSRFKDMLQTVTNQQDEQGRFTPGSVWMAYKEWDFGHKRAPSAWLTLLVARILKRIHL